MPSPWECLRFGLQKIISSETSAKRKVAPQRDTSILSEGGTRAQFSAGEAEVEGSFGFPFAPQFWRDSYNGAEINGLDTAEGNSIAETR